MKVQASHLVGQSASFNELIQHAQKLHQLHRREDDYTTLDTRYQFEMNRADDGSEKIRIATKSIEIFLRKNTDGIIDREDHHVRDRQELTTFVLQQKVDGKFTIYTV
jgi:hypothetical protein